ncbi:MAG: hypothetical protein ACF8PN_09800 [Phycisphaerales bacterium]
MTLEATGATPNSNVAFIYAFGTGSVAIPNGNPCAGTILDLAGGSAQLGAVVTSDASGTATVTPNVPAAACGVVVVQALDVATCDTSNVVEL